MGQHQNAEYTCNSTKYTTEQNNTEHVKEREGWKLNN